MNVRKMAFVQHYSNVHTDIAPWLDSLIGQVTERGRITSVIELYITLGYLIGEHVVLAQVEVEETMSEHTFPVFESEDQALTDSEDAAIQAMIRRTADYVGSEIAAFNKQHSRLKAKPHFHIAVEIRQE